MKSVSPNIWPKLIAAAVTGLYVYEHPRAWADDTIEGKGKVGVFTEYNFHLEKVVSLDVTKKSD